MKGGTPGKPILFTIDEIWEMLRRPPNKNLAEKKKALNRLGIPFVKIGTDHLFEATAFNDWFASRRQSPKKPRVVYSSRLGACRQ